MEEQALNYNHNAKEELLQEVVPPWKCITGVLIAEELQLVWDLKEELTNEKVEEEVSLQWWQNGENACGAQQQLHVRAWKKTNVSKVKGVQENEVRWVQVGRDLILQDHEGWVNELAILDALTCVTFRGPQRHKLFCSLDPKSVWWLCFSFL